MVKFEVVIKDTRGNRRSFMCISDSFTYAEEQAEIKADIQDDEEIIQIIKDYENE
jgi:hypothetical protein